MSFITDTITKYSVGGDADIAICVLPNASVLVATREAKALHSVPKEVQQKLFRVASDIAILAYEATQAHGTNIISLNHEHAHYLVIARAEEDGLPLRWNPGKATPAEIASLAGRLKDAAWTIGKKDVTEVSRPVLEEPKPSPLPTQTSTPKKPDLAEREIEKPGMRAPGDNTGHDLADVASEIQTPARKGPFGETDYRIKNLTRRR